MKKYDMYPTADYPDLKELLEKAGASYAGKPVFRTKTEDGIRDIGAEEFTMLVNRIGAAFLRQGLTGGRKIAVIGETSVEWIAVYFAVVCGGNVIVPIDKDLPIDEIAHLLKDSGADAVLYSLAMQSVMDRLEEL